MSTNHLEILQRAYRDFAAGNIPGVPAILDPMIEWTEAEGFPYGGTHVGPEAVLSDVFMK